MHGGPAAAALYSRAEAFSLACLARRKRRDVIQVANCFRWQPRCHKITQLLLWISRKVLFQFCLALRRKGKRLPLMSLLQRPVNTCVCAYQACPCVHEKLCNLSLAWQHSRRTSLSLLPVLSLCRSKKTLHKVLKRRPLGNDHNEKLHIMLGPAVL